MQKNQQIIDLTKKVQDYEKDLSLKEAVSIQKDVEIEDLRRDCSVLHAQIDELSATNQVNSFPCCITMPQLYRGDNSGFL